MRTLILFGTQTGNSELLAEEVAEALAEAGTPAEVVDMADAYPELLEEVDRLVVVLCTWADGTFPDNAVAFWEALEEMSPDCSRLAYGIVALGDRLYDPYYQVAAYRLADRIDALGARRAAETYEIDGRVRPSHRRAVRQWARWVTAEEASPSSLPPRP
jgi:sulfite reductase alpha subunit-like flavoprotein